MAKELKSLKIAGEEFEIAPKALQFFTVESEDDFYQGFENKTLKDGIHILDVKVFEKETLQGAEEGPVIAVSSNQDYLVTGTLEADGLYVTLKNISTEVVTKKLLTDAVYLSNSNNLVLTLRFLWNETKTTLFVLFSDGKAKITAGESKIFSLGMNDISSAFTTVQTLLADQPVVLEGENDTYILAAYQAFTSNAAMYVYSLKTNTFYVNLTGITGYVGRNTRGVYGENVADTNNFGTLRISGLNKNIFTVEQENIKYDVFQFLNRVLIIRPDNTFVSLENAIYSGKENIIIIPPESDNGTSDVPWFNATGELTYTVKKINFATGEYLAGQDQSLALTGTLRQLFAGEGKNVLKTYVYTASGSVQKVYVVDFDGEVIQKNETLTIGGPASGSGPDNTFSVGMLSGERLLVNSKIYKITASLELTLEVELSTTGAGNSISLLGGSSKIGNGKEYFMFLSYNGVSTGNFTTSVLFKDENNVLTVSKRTTSSVPITFQNFQRMFTKLNKFTKTYDKTLAGTAYKFVATDGNVLCFDNFEEVDTAEFGANFLEDIYGNYSTFSIKEAESSLKQNITFLGEDLVYIDQSGALKKLKETLGQINAKAELVRANFIMDLAI